MGPYTVLLADNDLVFLDTWTEILKRAGFRVVKARDPQEASARLADTWLHLAIIDMRLQNDLDGGDKSGLLVAKKAAPLVPKLILTRYPSTEDTRAALKPGSGGASAAIDFVDKRWEISEILLAIQQAIDTHQRVNERLLVRPSWPALLSRLAEAIVPERDRTILVERFEEMEHLLRVLFWDCRQITAVEWLQSLPGLSVVEIAAHSGGAHEERFILSCGMKERVLEERGRFDTFAPRGPGVGNTLRAATAETLHFSATTYVLAGSAPSDIMSLRVYLEREHAESVTRLLDRLYGATLGRWHVEGRCWESMKQSELYANWLGLDDQMLSERTLGDKSENISKLSLQAGLARIDYQPHTITLHLGDGTSAVHANPSQHLRHISSGADRTLCGSTHGRVDGDSVIVGSDGATWLVNFANAGRAPLLCDFLSLEMAVKVELLTTSDILTRYRLERFLLTVEPKDAIDLSVLPSEVRKAAEIAIHIRRLASQSVEGDKKQYQLGLLYCALQRLACFDPAIQYTRSELAPFAHSLLMAALVSEALDSEDAPVGDLPEQARTSIWIHPRTGDIWVQGRRKDQPTAQDLVLLHYLYRRAGEVCSYRDLVEQALGEKYDAGNPAERERLHSAISRLRRKIEPNRAKPRYILAVRGRGYRLQTT